MRIAIYCRKSVLTGKGESIENQIEMCKKYISSKIEDAETEIYEDEGFSAKSTERPEFKRLLRDVRAGAVQAIVCYRLDRISRNVSDFASLTEEFIERKVAFMSVREEFDTGTPMGKAMMYIASVFAQLERETIAERVKDNMRLLSKTGRWLGGTVPTGYKSEKHEVILDGKKHTLFALSKDRGESSKIQIIFSLFLNYKSVSRVRHNLLKSGIKTRFGKDFSETAIREILKNPVYAACDSYTYEYFTSRGAEVSFDKCDFGKAIMPYGRRKGKNGKTGIAEWVVAAGAHPYLVSGKDYVSAQTLLESKKTSNNRNASNSYALLSGIIYCKCGSEMSPKKRSNSKALFDYICRGKLYGGKKCCAVPNLCGVSADDAMWREAIRINPVTDKFFAETEKLKNQIKNKELRETKHETELKNQKIENLIEALSNGDGYFGERLKNEINRLQKEREKLAEEAKKSGNGTLKTDMLTTEDKRAFLKSFIDKAVWDGEKINVAIK